MLRQTLNEECEGSPPPFCGGEAITKIHKQASFCCGVRSESFFACAVSRITGHPSPLKKKKKRLIMIYPKLRKGNKIRGKKQRSIEYHARSNAKIMLLNLPQVLSLAHRVALGVHFLLKLLQLVAKGRQRLCEVSH